MKAKLPLIARLLLGFVFFASGLAGLLNLAPPPENMPEQMTTFMNGMMAAVYFMPLVKFVETLCGALLLSGFFVPLALVILAPVMLHIFLLHSFMMPETLLLPIIMGVLMIYLSFFSPYSPKIKALFEKK